jgi:hypothetical protein
MGFTRLAFVTLVATILVGTNISLNPASASVIIEGSVESEQWTWTAIEHSDCDGFAVRNVSHTPAGGSANYMFASISMPLIKAWYPQTGLFLVDNPGETGCVFFSDTVIYPTYEGIGNANRPATLIYAKWIIGGGPCPDDPLTVGCYTYEQQITLHDSYTTTSGGNVDPKVKHMLKIHGNGFRSTDGPPEYQAYFRVDTSIPPESNGDRFQRYTGTGWSAIGYEDSSTATCECWVEATSSGVQWRTFDPSIGNSKKINIDTRANDLPWVWVLVSNPTEIDPTSNQAGTMMGYEPQNVWIDHTSVNPANILYWYKTHRQSTATNCDNDSPCTVGPTLTLKGGL